MTNATLTGPSLIPCPPDGGVGIYTLTVQGTGASTSLAEWLNFAVYDEDPGLDDMLQNETLFYFVADDAAGNWQETLTFELWCANGCEVRGSYGGSWETTAEVYALIEDTWGNDMAATAVLEVSCVPEPSCCLLLVGGLAGIVLLGRRPRAH